MGGNISLVGTGFITVLESCMRKEAGENELATIARADVYIGSARDFYEQRAEPANVCFRTRALLSKCRHVVWQVEVPQKTLSYSLSVVALSPTYIARCQLKRMRRRSTGMPLLSLYLEFVIVVDLN